MKTVSLHSCPRDGRSWVLMGAVNIGNTAASCGQDKAIRSEMGRMS